MLFNEHINRAFDAIQKLPHDAQEKITDEQDNFSKVSFEEGMKAYRKIKERYDDLFRELAKL